MPVIGIVHAAEIRVLGPSCMEDYHAHLMRLDGSSCLPGDHRGIDAHCLDLAMRSNRLTNRAMPPQERPAPLSVHGEGLSCARLGEG